MQDSASDVLEVARILMFRALGGPMKFVLSALFSLLVAPTQAKATGVQRVAVSLLCQGVEDLTTGDVRLLIGIASEGQRGRLYLVSSDLQGRDPRLVNQPHFLSWRRLPGNIISYRTTGTGDAIELQTRQLPNGQIVGSARALLGGEGYGSTQMVCTPNQTLIYRGAPIRF